MSEEYSMPIAISDTFGLINNVVGLIDEAIMNPEWCLDRESNEMKMLVWMSSPSFHIGYVYDLSEFCAKAIGIEYMLPFPIGSVVGAIKEKKKQKEVQEKKKSFQQQILLECQRLILKQDALVKEIQKENERIKAENETKSNRLESLVCLNEAVNSLMNDLKRVTRG